MTSIRSELNSLVVGDSRSRDSTPAGLFFIFIELFLIAGSAITTEKLAQYFPSAAFPLQAVAVLFVGTRMRALGNMLHECAHGIFVKKASHNTLLGHLLAIFDLSSFPLYVAQHVSHHASLGHPDRDLDFKTRRHLLSEHRYKPFTIAKLVACCLTLAPLWIVLLRPVLWCPQSPRWSNVLRIFLLFTLATLCCLPSSRSWALTYGLIPWLTSYQWMKIFSDSSDHLFLLQKESFLERSRNHLLPFRFLNWLLFPRNDAYHLLHHLFPSIPVRHYPAVHRSLLSHRWYRSRTHAWNFSIGTASKKTKEAYGQSK